ncbi:MAG: SPW repeat protein [Pseudomonadota bacterium]
MTHQVKGLLPDTLMLLLGGLLFLSPWLFSFDAGGTIALSVQIAGALLFVSALLEIFVFNIWEEWVGAAVGVWLLAAPFVLGFNANADATIGHFAAGLVTIVLVALSVSDHDFFGRKRQES